MSYIPASLKRQVIERAGGCCEYCRIHEDDSDTRFHIEHIIAITHGGKTILENLALSCSRCNWLKGSNIAGADPQTDEPTFLFHPRRHHWDDHFDIEDVQIIPKTPEGRVTEFILRLNESMRVEHRQLLIQFNHYPCQSNER